MKTQWKNKRKFQELEEDIGPKQLKNGKDSPHSKICRFYNVNLSSTCICHNKCTQTKGTKRLNDETSAGEEPSKKMAFFASSTSVDQKQPNITLPKHPQSPIKLSLKRKLEDMPNFAEDNSKNKKINCGKILTRSNSAENNDKNKSVSDAVEVFKKYQKSCSENRQKENRFSSAERKDCSSFLIGISSPTSNLPNYIEDGTSPYLHRCSRMVQKENNWLTNLQEKRKKVQILEQTKGNPDVLPSFGQKKKIRSVDHTLHKYFKVTSKATEKNYNLQEIQKKNLLVK